jgi:hypothetical protein
MLCGARWLALGSCCSCCRRFTLQQLVLRSSSGCGGNTSWILQLIDEILDLLLWAVEKSDP